MKQKKSKKSPTDGAEKSDINPLIATLIEEGIELRFAQFGKPVLSYLKTPEYAFYTPEDNLKKERAAKMWFTPHGLVTEQKGHYKIIPLANIVDTIVL